MALKAIYTKQEDIPEAVKEHYAEKDVNGTKQWELQADGVKTQGDIDRLQEGLRKEREDHDASKAKLRDATQSLQTTKDELDVLKEKGGDGNREPTNDELIKLKQLERNNSELKEKLKVSEDGHRKLSSEVTAGTIKGELRKAAKGLIRDDAIEDVIEKVHQNFVISEGNTLTNADLGDKSGMSTKDYLSDYAKDRNYLAIPSKSGGAKGGRTHQTSDADGPMSTREFLESQGVQ